METIQNHGYELSLDAKSSGFLTLSPKPFALHMKRLQAVLSGSAGWGGWGQSRASHHPERLED